MCFGTQHLAGVRAVRTTHSCLTHSTSFPVLRSRSRMASTTRTRGTLSCSRVARLAHRDLATRQFIRSHDGRESAPDGSTRIQRSSRASAGVTDRCPPRPRSSGASCARASASAAARLVEKRDHHVARARDAGGKHPRSVMNDDDPLEPSEETARGYAPAEKHSDEDCRTARRHRGCRPRSATATSMMAPCSMTARARGSGHPNTARGRVRSRASQSPAGPHGRDACRLVRDEAHGRSSTDSTLVFA
jgi:hypothetical protein